MNLYGYEVLREDDLIHHGIKGQKWGERRFQNEDGSLTAAGKDRYSEDGGSGKKLSRAEKKVIRKEYRNAQRERNKELDRINEKYDKLNTENTYGLNSGSASDRFKKHLENEYKRSQEINKWDQKNLDAKRQYRAAIGKRKTETLLMKWQQESINDISKQTQSEFNRDYIENLASQAMNAAQTASSGKKEDDDW